jgi:penicillin-binding protein 2
MLSSQGREAGQQFALPPGSTLKPLVLLALLESRLLRPDEVYACPGLLRIGDRRMTCSHPRLSVPLDIAKVLAYSCNCAIAHYVPRIAPGDLRIALRHYGLDGPASTIATATSVASLQLLALGEEGVRVTPLELLRSYRVLARRSAETALAPIVSGLEGAVAFGTAQNARVEHVQVAGKTGTVRADSGNHYGWFVGFAPSRNPAVVAASLVPGRSGGADAAPVAAELLRRYFAGIL